MSFKPKRVGDVYNHVGDFMTNVGHLQANDLKSFGFLVEDQGGTVKRERLDELLLFCEQNPDLHVISIMTDGTLLNRAADKALYYLVGDGDPNPRLKAKDVDFLRSLIRFKAKLSSIVK